MKKVATQSTNAHAIPVPIAVSVGVTVVVRSNYCLLGSHHVLRPARNVAVKETGEVPMNVSIKTNLYSTINTWA